jgi:ABC-type antimicrobial peptide transport system permease subunit
VSDLARSAAAAILGDALRGLRARRGRTALAAGVILAAALVLGVVVSAAYALGGGFERAAERADLPSVLARFDGSGRAEVDARVRALPNLAARAYRTEFTRVRLAAGGHSLDEGVVHAVGGPRRGYAITAGRDLRASGDEVVVEAGLARQWKLRPGDRLAIGGLGPFRIVGVALAPDNVSYPLVRTARVYVARHWLEQRLGRRLPVNVALLWARDESRTDVLLSQARASAGGMRALRFTTRAGVRTLVESAAGLVIALLTAFALVSAALAGVLLAASARSEVARRLPAIGVRRAVGAGPGTIVALHAAEGALVAALPAAAGLALGGPLAAGPVRGVLESLNELAPGPVTTTALLAAVWAGAVVLVALASAWPAWRAARRSPAALLRRGDVQLPRARRWSLARWRQRQARVVAIGGAPQSPWRGGLLALGAQLVCARRARFAALVAVLGAATAVVLLLLALASLLTALRDDPAALGKRYQLTAQLSAERLPEVATIPGVRAVAPRYELRAVSATALGSPLRLIAYPGDHTRFEAPPLASGRRLRSDGEAEVGAGLADALGLRVGSTLAVQAAAAQELRFRVVGVVRALQDEGRVAYVRPARLEAALGSLSGPLVLRLDPGADQAAVRRRLSELGAAPQPVSGATGDSRGLLDVLARLLRVVALTVALVCLSALAQALALTAAERRGAFATLRATGADGRALRRLLFGAALAVAAPATLLALVLETLLLAPATERLAAGYADLPLQTDPAQVVLTLTGLLVLCVAASAGTARRLLREPVVAGLREAER